MPETSVQRETDERGECSCWSGFHFIGYMVESAEDLDGEVEVYERVPCRRCKEEVS